MIDESRLDGIGPCDCLYISPHADDAALSCPGGIYDERAQGLDVLVVNLFGEEPASPPRDGRPTALLGAREAFIGIPAARHRHEAYATFQPQMERRHEDDDAILPEAENLLVELLRRTQPRHVYAPLGVWGHVDHRLTYDAARSVLEPRAGRDVFFYEERPFALLAGSVRIRLAQLGARLPPAAAAFGDHGSLLRFVLGFRTDPFVRSHFRGFWDGMKCSRVAARDWRASWGWKPLKALGPRFQPALHPSGLDALKVLDDAVSSLPHGSPFGTRGRFWSLLEAHARRLGQEGPSERYWLLLPQRESLPEGEFAELSTAS